MSLAAGASRLTVKLASSSSPIVMLLLSTLKTSPTFVISTVIVWSDELTPSVAVAITVYEDLVS